MSTIRHICQGGAAAERVREVVGQSVFQMMDDYAVGPLNDIDSSSPDARIVFWAEMFALGGTTLMDMRTENRVVNEALANLGRDATEVVIWAGSSPTEQAMRRRIYWWLQDAPVLITEVLVDCADVATSDYRGYAPIAAVSIERLRSRFEQRRAPTNECRRQLVADWTVLRNKGLGVRTWEGGSLSERPIDHYDNHLLSLVGTEPASFLKVLGQAMTDTGLTDIFCTWRFAVLIQTGHLLLTPYDMQDWRSAISPPVSRSVRIALRPKGVPSK